VADGSIALIDEKGDRVIADGFRFADEIGLDAKECCISLKRLTSVFRR